MRQHPFDDGTDGGVAAAADDGLARLERRVDRALLHLGVAPDAVDVRPVLSERVTYWLARGSLIHAIREYRGETGGGLKEAKDAVEGVAKVPPLERLERKLDALLTRLGADPEDEADSADDLPPDPLEGESVDSLLRQDRLIEASKAYRQRTGAGLAEAKSAVEARLRQMAAPREPGP